LIDGVKGKGQYVGTYLAWRVNDNCWWGEGEIKFYMDGDREYPTICGTGTEDYFCGSYNFENQKTRQYQEFTTPYAADSALHIHPPAGWQALPWLRRPVPEMGPARRRDYPHPGAGPAPSEDTARFAYLLSRLKKSMTSLLCYLRDEQKQSCFHPAACELRIGSGEDAVPG